jgi:hypothetical protein
VPISDEQITKLRALVSRDIASMTEAEHVVFKVVPALLDEVESLRDSTLQKDFLALYQAARMVTSAQQTSAPSIDVEGLALHVVRLAPLYDDVRASLNALLVRRAWPVGGELARQRALVAQETGQAPHTVRVQQLDGTVSVECDHTFKGTTRCVHCGKAFAELRREASAEREQLGLGPETLDLRLPSLLPDGVLHATPDELADVIARQLDEHEGRGIIALRGISELDTALEPDDEFAVPIVLGPTLRPRVEALVATNRLGCDLEHVVQTLFVLGMLDAEGQDPQAHVGAPHSHVSAEAMFVRFGLPHEGGAEAARQRASILRQLLLDLAEWCDEADPLRPALLAGIEHLPRA